MPGNETLADIVFAGRAYDKWDEYMCISTPTAILPQRVSAFPAGQRQPLSGASERTNAGEAGHSTVTGRASGRNEIGHIGSVTEQMEAVPVIHLHQRAHLRDEILRMRHM